MRKVTKILAMSLILAVIMIVSITGAAFAAGPGPNPDYPNPDCPNIDCPNPDCPNADCPNPDCLPNGDENKYKKGKR